MVAMKREARGRKQPLVPSREILDEISLSVEIECPRELRLNKKVKIKCNEIIISFIKIAARTKLRINITKQRW